MPRSSGTRNVNWSATREKYKQRIEIFPPELWAALNGAYLGTFEIYSTIADIQPDSHLDCFAGVILRSAREKGYTPLGVTSERKHDGVFICSKLNDVEREACRIVYVGKYSYFSQHEKSPWSPVSGDYVYNAPAMS
jgi:hypothetical protein